MLKNNIALIKNVHCFHTTCGLNGGQPGRFLRKIMGGSKKKKYYAAEETPVLPSTSNNFGRSSIEAKITGNPRRSNVLNKVFMRHVTDIMATGEYSKDILGFGIEVNKVKVSPDYKFLRVYWIANESANHDEIEDVLNKSAGLLRHELSTLRVMGEIPNIVFVRDKNYSKLAQVQERLNRADFGEDYEPPDYSAQFKSELEILTSLDANVKEKLEKFELESADATISEDINEIPPMPQNVLGLNHADILKRLKKGLSVSRAAHRSESEPDTVSEWAQWSEFKTTQPINNEPVTFASSHEQRSAFKAFLQHRQIMKMKQHRIDKNWTADRDYLEEELYERRQRNIQFDEEIDEDDYILYEAEEEKKYAEIPLERKS